MKIMIEINFEKHLPRFDRSNLILNLEGLLVFQYAPLTKVDTCSHKAMRARIEKGFIKQ